MIKKEKFTQFYVYIDFIEATGEIIYCGKGDTTRSNPNKKHKRNRQYNFIANKYKIKTIRIPTINEDLAFKLEIWLIAKHHTWIKDPIHNQHACNQTKGGEGISGWKHTEEARDKIKSKRALQNFDQKYYDALHEGQKNKPPDTQETKDKKRKSNIGKKRSEQTRNNIKLATKNRTNEHWEKIHIAKCKKVQQINKLTGEKNIYSSITECAKHHINVYSPSLITRRCHGQISKHSVNEKFIWSFVNLNDLFKGTTYKGKDQNERRRI